MNDLNTGGDPSTSDLSHHGHTFAQHSETMEFDPTAPPSNDNPNADSMDTSLDRPFDGASNSQNPDVVGGTGHAAPTEPPTMQQQTSEGHGAAQLSQQPAPAPPRSYLTQDLLSVYGLHSLVASVARTDPATGEKINKMRKSYEGKIKQYSLMGKNKAINVWDESVMKSINPSGSYEMSLQDMMQRLPEEEWRVQKVDNRPLSKGLPASIMAKLEKAMQLQPGPLPRQAYWEEQLGVMEKTKPVSAKLKQSNGVTNGARPHAINTQATASEVARPKRTAKKRRYDDAAFEGYGEGFVDDEADILDAGGYESAEENRRASAAKKRKTSSKDFAATSPTIDRGGTYGPGIIGVGGSYGR